MGSENKTTPSLALPPEGEGNQAARFVLFPLSLREWGGVRVGLFPLSNINFPLHAAHAPSIRTPIRLSPQSPGRASNTPGSVVPQSGQLLSPVRFQAVMR